TERAGQALRLSIGVLTKLRIEVLAQRLADVEETCLLGLPIGIHKGTQPHVPRIVGQLLGLGLRELPEGLERVGPWVLDGDGDELGMEGDLRRQGWIVHALPESTKRSSGTWRASSCISCHFWDASPQRLGRGTGSCLLLAQDSLCSPALRRGLRGIPSTYF